MASLFWEYIAFLILVPEVEESLLKLILTSVLNLMCNYLKKPISPFSADLLAQDGEEIKFGNSNIKVIKGGDNQALLSVSDALILTSGTVALEACLYKTPMVIAYRGPFLFYLIYLLVRSIKNACLVNIISKKDIVPEFLMYNATPEKISNGILNIIKNEKAKEAQILGFNEVEKLLGDKHCAEVAANIISKELE